MVRPLAEWASLHYEGGGDVGELNFVHSPCAAATPEEKLQMVLCRAKVGRLTRSSFCNSPFDICLYGSSLCAGLWDEP
jgi:hypothetical protein